MNSTQANLPPSTISGRCAAILALACWIGHGLAWAGDSIYVAYDDAGTPHFSSQPYDPSFRAYWRDQTPAQASISTFQRNGQGQAPKSLAPLIRKIAQEHGVDPALVSALVAVESAYNPKVVSAKGAVGAMQLLPKTAAHYGVENAYDLQQNLAGGTRYLKDLLSIYRGNLALALAAYNAGPGNVQKHHQRIPPFGETMLYVPKVLAKMEEFQRTDAAIPE